MSVTGELDLRTTELLSARLAEAMRAGVSELTLDLTRLAFMDSTGVRLPDRAQLSVQARAMAAPAAGAERPGAAHLLRITAIDSALPFESGR